MLDDLADVAEPNNYRTTALTNGTVKINVNTIDTRVVPKLMPPIYFHGNYTRYKEHNNTI